jgi:hypothetical protein
MPCRPLPQVVTDSVLPPETYRSFAFLTDSGAAVVRRMRSALHPPTADGRAAAPWTVRLWAVEEAAVLRFECAFRPPRWWRPRGADLRTADSIRIPAWR